MSDAVISQSQSNVLDYAQLDQMKELMGEVFSELVPAYIKQSDTMINDMPGKLAAQDLSALELYSHSLKSSSHSVGAMALSQLSSEIEALSRDQQLTDELSRKVELICQDYKQVRQALMDYSEKA